MCLICLCVYDSHLCVWFVWNRSFYMILQEWIKGHTKHSIFRGSFFPTMLFGQLYCESDGHIVECLFLDIIHSVSIPKFLDSVNDSGFVVSVGIPSSLLQNSLWICGLFISFINLGSGCQPLYTHKISWDFEIILNLGRINIFLLAEFCVLCL